MRFVSAHSCNQAGPKRRFRLVARRLALGAAMVITTAAMLEGQVAQALRVIPLVRGDQVFVTFELRDGFTREVRAAIHSGLKTTFTYTIDLRVDVAGWIDRSMSSAVVTSSVEYDNLERKYQVERRIDGRLAGPMLLSENEEEVRLWMTHMKELRLFPTSILERNREYYVRVSASARPSPGSMLWPFGSATSAQAKFTFIR